jgi:hypothetical protein
MKVGDIVTQSDEFYKHWKCETFHLRIVKITDRYPSDGTIMHLEKPITITKITGNGIKWPVKGSDFHHKFLKIDIKEMRKEKLKKLNSL